MPDSYLRTPIRSLIDRGMAAAARRGWAPGGVTALTVVGRRSGEPRTVPVTPLQHNGRLYLVAPYGVVDWVHNLRAAGEATLERGRSHRVRATEVSAAEAAPVLRSYVQQIPIVRPHVAADPDDELAVFEAIAADHPVFSVTRIG